jgi:hypothetical protein
MRLHHQYEQSTTLHTKRTNGGKRRTPDETIQKVFLRCGFCDLLVLSVWSLLVFFFCFLDVFCFFLRSLLTMTLGDLGLGMRWTWHETNGNGYGLETCIALGVCFFLLPFGSMHMRRTVFSYAHSLWTACINELYEPFLTLIYFLLLTCLREYPVGYRCMMSLKALLANTFVSVRTGTTSR